MYNNANNNMNPLFSLLGLTGGQGGGQQPQSQPKPSQGGGAGAGAGGMDPNNPLIQLLTAMMGGQNAMNALQNIMPMAAQYAQNNRGAQNMEQFVRNEYNARGIDINGAMEQLQQLMNAMNGQGAMNGQNGYNAQGAQNGYNAQGGQNGYNAQGANNNTQQNTNNY